MNDSAKGEDSFSSPKDMVNNFFQVGYALKEALKNDRASLFYKDNAQTIEKFCSNSPIIALSLDIANQDKHILLSNRKTDHRIGEINTHIHMLSPDGRPNRTEVTIEIDGKREDGLSLAR